jgi:hypothetical protein
MLLDRSMPNDQQGFGDYLSDLARKNGFCSVGKFKRFLIDSANRRYKVSSNYANLTRIISGLFIELGIDQVSSPDVTKPQCFRCLTAEPKGWVWSVVGQAKCSEIVKNYSLFSPCQENLIADRSEYCGLMICSARKLGLNFLPSKEGRYFADIFSGDERVKSSPSKIYPSYKAFTKM